MSSSTTNSPELYQVGQLLQLKHLKGFTRLHSHFVQPNQIWEALQIFWGNKGNRSRWGDRVMGMPREAPKSAMEWVTAIRMECAWDVAQKYKIDQKDLARRVELEPGAMLMVMDVIVTPWKKRYRWAGGSEKRQRFSYVRFLTTLEDKPIYVHYDVSHMHGTYKSVEIEPKLFELLS